jgi:VIT1/CCC1 family predicted Fe2+/Mn2+ transporter
MLSQGPVPLFVHGAIEYAAGVLFIVAPFLFAFDSTSATAASVVIGLGMLAFTAMSRLPTALVKSISTGVHVTVDVVLAVLLVALPFLLGFTEEGAPTALFITLGVLHLLVTIATRFPERSASRDEETHA